jgi:HSP20 family molecular chaperone IbpA
VQEELMEHPEIITFVDAEKSELHIEITLINTEKENVSLMMDEKGLYLSAPSEDVNYVTTLSFIRPVKPSEAKATLWDGYLRIEVPFMEPLENYIKVPVQDAEDTTVEA